MLPPQQAIAWALDHSRVGTPHGNQRRGFVTNSFGAAWM